MQSSKKLKSPFLPIGLFTQPKTILEDPIAINISQIDNAYKILNISENASEEDILKSYKKLALKYHPDRHQEQDETRAFATVVIQKLNAAREAALAQLTIDKQETDQDASLGDYQTFTDHVKSIVLSDVLGRLSTENLHLLHADENYCLAMVLNWVDHVLNQDQTSFFKALKLSFSKKSTAEPILYFAKQNHRYIFDQMDDNIRARTLNDVLTKARACEDSSIKSSINITWNFEIQMFSNKIVDLITRLPNTPFLIHNVQEKGARYIGILYQEGRFYLFSPYHLLIDRDKNLLQPLNQEEITYHLLEHFNLFPTMIPHESAYATIAIAICSFEVVPKLLLEDRVASLVSHELQFVNYILHRHRPATINDARLILQSIRDCYIRDLLSEVYAQSSEFFSLELLYEFLDEAIEREHLLLAFEICNIDPQNTALIQRLATYYINHYLTHAKDYRHLVSILEAFGKAKIDLGGWIRDSLKTKEGTVLKETTMLMNDKATLQCFLQLGFQLNENQRQQLVHQFSTDIDKQAKSLNAALIESVVCKREVAPKLRDKIETSIQSAIERMQVLIAYGYSLHIGQGYTTSNHPYLALVNAKQNTLAKRYCEEGIINLDAKDNDGKTILNHMTKLENWEMVAFLYGMNAPYASGSSVSYHEIPALVGWLKQIELLRPWYLPRQPQVMLSLMTKEGDPLCVALSSEKDEQVEFLLRNGYADKLKKTPLFYLYRARGFKTMKLLLNHMSLTDILHLSKEPPKVSDNYQADDLLQELPMSKEVFKRGDWANLIGFSCDEVDQAVSRLPFSSLTKVSADGSNTIFYSSNVELTEVLSLFFHTSRLDQHIKSIEALLTITEPYQVPDISYFINTLNNISLFIDRALYLLRNYKLQSRYFEKYFIDERNYINSFECLEGNEMPMGLQVTFDKEQKACDFRFIADTTVVLFGDVISCDGRSLIKGEITRLYQSLSGDIWSMLVSLEQLKMIFEDIFDIKFSPTSVYKNPIYGDSAFYIELFRTEWSEHKKEMEATGYKCYGQ